MVLRDIVEFVMALEEAFGVEIEDSEAESMQTVGDLHRAIIRSTAASPADVWPAIVGIFEMNGIPPEKIKPEARLRDLFEG